MLTQNDLELLSGDIENAYLTAPCREKVWLKEGPEFRGLDGTTLITQKALYGLESSGAAFLSFLAETLDHIGFRSSIAVPDVWMRAAAKPDGEAYYEYILCYVDDILCISHDAERPMKQIGNTMKFKGNKVKQLDNRYVWTMMRHDYEKGKK